MTHLVSYSVSQEIFRQKNRVLTDLFVAELWDCRTYMLSSKFTTYISLFSCLHFSPSVKVISHLISCNISKCSLSPFLLVLFYNLPASPLFVIIKIYAKCELLHTSHYIITCGWITMFIAGYFFLQITIYKHLLINISTWNNGYYLYLYSLTVS